MNSYCCQQSLCRQQFFQAIVWWHMTSQHVATHHCDSLMVYHIIYFNLYLDWIRRLWGIYLWILLLPNFSPFSPYSWSRIIAKYRLLFQGEFVYFLLVRIIDWCCHCPCTIQPTILNLMTVILLFSVLQLWILFNHGAHSDYLIHVTAVKLCHFFFISDFVNLKNRFLNQKDIKKARCMGLVCLSHW